jgi:hypothetical protein
VGGNYRPNCEIAMTSIPFDGPAASVIGIADLSHFDDELA